MSIPATFNDTFFMALLLLLSGLLVWRSLRRKGWTGFLHSLACATISFACLSLFLRFAGAQNAVLDNLDRNSYGIYVIHCGIVSWVLFAVLGLAWPAMLKFLVAAPLALAICWAITAALRRVPGVDRVI